MRKFLIVQALGLLLMNYCAAQVIPKDGDTVNYRLAGFSVPENKKADNYLFEIARGSYTSEKIFKENIIIKERNNSNQIIQLLPAFGESYTWRVHYLRKEKQIGSTKLFHLYTGYIDFIDTQKMRIRVITNNVKKDNFYIFFDNTRTLRDLNGDAVWYLPEIPNATNPNTGVRDLKMTPQGTITFLSSRNIYEVDYSGKLLWSGPNDGRISHDTTEYYHHEFTRLKNGHYMAAGNEYLDYAVPETIDSNTIKYRGNIKREKGKFFRKLEFGTLIEYDSLKNIVWSWRSSEPLGKNILPPANKVGKPDIAHMNSFFFDESINVIYISFRNINSILKIKYPEGTVLATYGDLYLPLTNKGGAGLFMGQHNATEKNGHIFIFNNNINATDRKSDLSYLVILKEPESPADTIKKEWEFSCDIDTFAAANCGAGGSMTELHDKTILACMGIAGRVFIVDRNKNVLWNALSEWKEPYSKNWLPQNAGYRASVIEDRPSLFKLIFR
jgi:hypothetical protein